MFTSRLLQEDADRLARLREDVSRLDQNIVEADLLWLSAVFEWQNDQTRRNLAAGILRSKVHGVRSSRLRNALCHDRDKETKESKRHVKEIFRLEEQWSIILNALRDGVEEMQDKIDDIETRLETKSDGRGDVQGWLLYALDKAKETAQTEVRKRQEEGKKREVEKTVRLAAEAEAKKIGKMLQECRAHLDEKTQALRNLQSRHKDEEEWTYRLQSKFVTLQAKQENSRQSERAQVNETKRLRDAAKKTQEEQGGTQFGEAAGKRGQSPSPSGRGWNPLGAGEGS